MKEVQHKATLVSEAFGYSSGEDKFSQERECGPVGCNVPLKAAAPCSVVIAQNSLNQKAEWPSSSLSLRGAALKQ